MGETELARLPMPLPDSVTVSASLQVRFTPNEMRQLKQATGRTMTDLMGEDGDDADRMQAMAWLELRRQGHDPTWDQAGDVALVFEAEAPDPTNEGS